MENELRDTKIRRLKMRSMRRGIREMDLILQAFAERSLEAMSDSDLNTYDALLDENDHDLYRWVSGHKGAPEKFESILDQIVSISIGVVAPSR